MQHNFSVHNLVPFALEEFVEVQIKEVLQRQVAHIETREFVLLLPDISGRSLTTSNVHVRELLHYLSLLESRLVHLLLHVSAGKLLISL